MYLIPVAYILTVIVLNVLYGRVPPLHTIVGSIYPATFLVGVVFVLRDFVQFYFTRIVTFLCMTVAICLTALFTPHAIVMASWASFLLSELTAFYLFERMPQRFVTRMLVTTFVAAPIDTFVFLTLAGLRPSLATAFVAIAMKLAASLATAIGLRYAKT